MLLSLAMIVRNEEATLAHCLESVKPIVDEMVILDTGSTDKTIEIAMGFGALVYNYQWCDDFSAARNESLKHCRGDWVLVLDADEAIDPLDYEKIRNACANPYADAYELTHRHYLPSATYSTGDAGAVPNKSEYTEGKHLSFYSDNPTCRLSRLFDGLTFLGRLHETMDNSLSEHGKTIKPLDAVLHHYGKLLSDREVFKSRYYLMIAAQEADKNMTSLKAQYNLLQEAIPAKRWDLALSAAEQCAKIIPEPDSFVLFGWALALQELGRHQEAIKQFDLLLNREQGHVKAMSGKAMSMIALGNVSAGRQTMLETIRLNPDFATGYLYLAQLEMKKKDMDAARKILLNAIIAIPNEPRLYDQLINIELLEGNIGQVAHLAEKAIKMCPGMGDGTWQNLVAQCSSQMAELELESGFPELARQLIEDAMELVTDAPFLYDMLIKIEMMGEDMPQAAQVALQGIQCCPGGSVTWYRLAAVCLSSDGDAVGAKSVLEEGLKSFPGDADLTKLMGIV
jgi:glycosyltransferase involved in cell wall biosynthesis